MMLQLRPFVKKAKWAIVAYQIYNSWRSRRRFKSGDYGTTDGTTHTGKTVSESLDYINHVFDDYIKYSDITHVDLREKKILEIGPGDNLGVALMFLAWGAAQVVCLDKFFSRRDSQQQRSIYEQLQLQLGDNSGQLVDTAIALNTGTEIAQDKLRYIYGHGIEEADHLFEPKFFDLIVSRAVLEVVYDIDTAFSAMDRLLAPGGLMLHKIDFRDLGVFGRYGMHPLTFLTIPDSIYKLMAVDSGKPNRKLINYYRQKMTELGYDTKVLITHIVGEGGEIFPHKEQIDKNVDYSEATNLLINEIRPKLSKGFRDLPDEELMVSGIFLVAKKPG